MPPDALKGWYVILLRPALTRGPLQRAVRALGATPVLLPGLRLVPAADRKTADRDLGSALRAPLVLVSSPAAVHFARQLPAWRAAAGARFAAVGSGTADALRRAGAVDVMAAQRRQDSEGLLAVPALRDAGLSCVGLISAPGGRGLLDETMNARGVEVLRADVYRRLPARLDVRHQRALAAIDGPSALLHSSAEALTNLRAGLPLASWRQLLRARLIPSSERLAQQARSLGFTVGPVAASAMPGDLLETLQGMR